jgi:hypothetical protein
MVLWRQTRQNPVGEKSSNIKERGEVKGNEGTSGVTKERTRINGIASYAVALYGGTVM